MSYSIIPGPPPVTPQRDLVTVTARVTWQKQKADILHLSTANV
jgi:hypothetical protein